MRTQLAQLGRPLGPGCPLPNPLARLGSALWYSAEQRPLPVGRLTVISDGFYNRDLSPTANEAIGR